MYTRVSGLRNKHLTGRSSTLSFIKWFSQNISLNINRTEETRGCWPSRQTNKKPYLRLTGASQFDVGSIFARHDTVRIFSVKIKQHLCINHQWSTVFCMSETFGPVDTVGIKFKSVQLRHHSQSLKKRAAKHIFLS